MMQQSLYMSQRPRKAYVYI